MRILGLSGGPDFPHEELFHSKLLNSIVHDSAAVLIEDGRVVAAYEEERLNRIKHTGKFPFQAVRRCLESRDLTLNDIDKIVYYCAEPEVKFESIAHRNQYRAFSYHHPKRMFAERLQQLFGTPFSEDNVVFVNHHYCHAASAYYMSGFDEALVVTLDGASPEGASGMFLSVKGDDWQSLDKLSNGDSLGAFYTQVIEYLGYTSHDEYKVMGLAPYGDPGKFRRLFRKAFRLLPEGKVQFNSEWYFVFMDFLQPRLKGGPFTQEHRDVAAALQETLETIVMHMLSHYRQLTGHTKLCLAGGVAHNCSMNGKLLYAGLFEEIFVQPAAHDAGNALGGALYVSRKTNPAPEPEPLRHLYWGTDAGDSEHIASVLRQWEPYIAFRKSENVVAETAKRLAEGLVVGWVQGRAEFGPRALGNRSILADPRPAENKRIINEMVKKRESYRPFAPSVMEEYIADYYVMPDTKAPLAYMNFVLQTQADKQPLLGAVTHVDGTARVQSVSRAANERYWELIDAFRKQTGVPILLNTSFNNNAEPIVDSANDAVVSFLTTNIDLLVIGDYLVEKKLAKSDYIGFVPHWPVHAELTKAVGHEADGSLAFQHEIRLHFGDRYKKGISGQMFKLLESSDGKRTVGELIQQLNVEEQAVEGIVDEIDELWSSRLITLVPSVSSK